MIKNKNWSSKRRKSKNIPIGTHILIVCCGQCTEPNYFSYILTKIKENMQQKSQGITKFKYKIIPCAKDPKKMADKVKHYIESSEESYNEVYVVFDKDSYTNDNFDTAIKTVKEYNKQYRDITFVPLWSNQCIELWFLLHFEYMHSQITREQYFEKLEKILEKQYIKNDKQTGESIFKKGGTIDKAINNSKKLMDNSKEEEVCSKKDPATNVFVFFEKYKDYIK